MLSGGAQAPQSKHPDSAEHAPLQYVSAVRSQRRTRFIAVLRPRWLRTARRRRKTPTLSGMAVLRFPVGVRRAPRDPSTALRFARDDSFAVTLSGASFDAQSKGPGLEEDLPVQFVRAPADPLSGPLDKFGVIALLSCRAKSEARSRDISTSLNIHHHDSLKVHANTTVWSPLDKLGVTNKSGLNLMIQAGFIIKGRDYSSYSSSSAVLGVK